MKIAVFGTGGERQFLGHAIRNIEDHRQVEFDLLLVATLERSEGIVEYLVELGIEPAQGRICVYRRATDRVVRDTCYATLSARIAAHVGWLTASDLTAQVAIYCGKCNKFSGLAQLAHAR